MGVVWRESAGILKMRVQNTREVTGAIWKETVGVV